ncbi:hypothetical protein BCR33DRAFT_856690 [Rhizoclosmatium globosum]|uniref:Uncharacterized protein n=1 Tax=Rhizoclosmatium globosum TaxID=329046 RepID=A0A1Y2BBI5_9FUNG|nr:hypothetical protein BCR33DRAFT_856690 [Rhizoclosmatium globosum]|eukprot:ORY32066.1 hypothetical protein BCR33DRAFT_856690 [Rhizoclosmatium globosum]
MTIASHLETHSHSRKRKEAESLCNSDQDGEDDPAVSPGPSNSSPIGSEYRDVQNQVEYDHDDAWPEFSQATDVTDDESLRGPASESEEEEEQEPRYFDNESDIPLVSATESSIAYSRLVSLLVRLKTDSLLCNKFTLFLQCMQQKWTHQGYSNLVNTRWSIIQLGNRCYSLSELAGFPQTLQTLTNQIFKLIGSFLPMESFETEVHHKPETVPYMSLKTAVLIWLSSPGIAASIQKSNLLNVLPNISCVNTAQILKDRMKEYETRPEDYGIESAETSVEFLGVLLRTMDQWLPAYAANNIKPPHLKRKVRFLHLSMYQDDFGWMGTVNTKRGQTVFCLTAMEIERGIRAKTNGLGVLAIMLTKSAIVKGKGGMNLLLGCYADELEEFIKGIEFTIGNETFLVFAVIYLYTGDIPARNRILGRTIAVNQRFACHTCETPTKEFCKCALDATKLKSNRSPAQYKALLDANGRIGEINGPNKTVAEASGVVEIPITATFPGQNVPVSTVVDLMHSEPLGTLHKEFALLSASLTPNHLPKMSNEFDVYGRRNHLESRYDFHDLNSLKGLHGHGLLLFFLVSPYLLVKLKLINQSNSILCSLFRNWCCRIRLLSLMCSHSLTPAQFAEMESLITGIMKFYGENHPRLVTINMHFLQHVCDYIKNYGLLRDHWSFVYEHHNGIIKSCYSNTNNRKVSFGVYRRLLSVYTLELLDQIAGKPNQCPKQNDIPPADSYLHLPPSDTLIQAESNIPFQDCQLYTNANGDPKLNWQTLRDGDWILLRVGEDDPIIGMFVAAATTQSGREPDLLLFRKPRIQRRREKRVDGSLQWLVYSESAEVGVVYVSDAAESFIRRLKTLKIDETSVLIVDGVDELFWLYRSYPVRQRSKRVGESPIGRSSVFWTAV